MSGGPSTRLGRRIVSAPRRRWSARSAGSMPPPTAPTGLPGSLRSFAPEGIGRAPKRVARLMRAHRIAGVRPRRPKRTTTPARSTAALPDLVRRRFGVGAPDRAWVSDITYVRTGQGWLYLAVVLDLGSRRLLGYAMSARIDTRLVADALDMAAAARQGRTAGTVSPLRPRQPIPRRELPQDRRRLGTRPVSGPSGVLSGQRGGRGVLLEPQARARPPAPLPRPRDSTPVDLRMARPLQHHQTPHQPRQPHTRPARTAVPSTRGQPARLIHLTSKQGEVPNRGDKPTGGGTCCGIGAGWSAMGAVGGSWRIIGRSRAVSRRVWRGGWWPMPARRPSTLWRAGIGWAGTR